MLLKLRQPGSFRPPGAVVQYSGNCHPGKAGFFCCTSNVILFYEKALRKDKLWKIEVTVLAESTANLRKELNEAGLSNKYIPNIGRYTEFNIYCPTQAESAKAKEILSKYNAKYFVTESKTLI